MSDYYYFISYNADGGVVGRTATIRRDPISSIEEIEKTEKSIEKRHNYTNVVITHWKRFETPPVRGDK